MLDLFLSRLCINAKSVPMSVAMANIFVDMTECSSVRLGTLVPFMVYIDELATDVTCTFIEFLI